MAGTRTCCLLAALVAALCLEPSPTRADLPLGSAMVPWPDAGYDPAIPAPDGVLGYGFGAEITTHADIRRYFEALAAAAPDRVRLVDFGRSWQGRTLFYAVISAPRNLQRLEAVKQGMQRLADPRRTPAAEAEPLIADLPAPVWLTYSVHGDEAGTGDAAMLTAYHLLAARGDARVATMLENTVVIINPVQNPDGRDRFIASTRSARGLEADDDPLSAERDQPWPGGRFNHYAFDLNRDWFAQTQPETRAQTRAILSWFPVVLADVHEMGTDQTFFFPPAARPTNPFITPTQNANRELIGRNNARWFDARGLDYFTREVFDLFYPGYGDGWPTYHGAVAMTYEQGSSRGLVARRRTGERVTFADTVESQAIASLSAIEVVAGNRAKFLRDFYDYRASAVEEGRKAPNRVLILPDRPDRAGAAKLAGLLARQGIEVGRTTEGFSACGKSYAAGTYVIDSAQPAKRLIRVLMDPQIELEADFVAEQERRRARGLPDEIYDVTAWSLPHLYNLTVDTCGREVRAAMQSVGPDFAAEGTLANAEAKLAYLVPWGDTAGVRFLTGALKAGLRVKSSDEPFTHGGTRFPGGTLILERAENPADLPKIVAALARDSGAGVVGVDESWVTDGPNFGSAKVVEMRAPRVAMAWDRPTGPTTAGATRFVVERQFGHPVTVIRTDLLARADLSAFDVLLLPQDAGGGYMDRFGERGGKSLKEWVRRGGVLIGLGTATRFLAHPKVDLLSIRREELAPMPEPGEEAENGKRNGGGGKGGGKGGDRPGGERGPEDGSPTVPGTVIADPDQARAAIRPDKRPPDAVAGVLARASTDADHWMGAGLAETVHVLVQGEDIYTPAKLDEGTNVARFKGPDELLAGGYLWEENRRQLAFKPFAVVEPEGRGYVVGFTADPTLRGFMDGLNVLLANAIFRGAAHAEPMRRPDRPAAR